MGKSACATKRRRRNQMFGWPLLRVTKPLQVVRNYFVTRNITTPCDGTIAEYSGLSTVTSLCNQRSRTFGRPLNPRSAHFRLIFASSAERLNKPTAFAPPDNSRDHTS